MTHALTIILTLWQVEEGEIEQHRRGTGLRGANIPLDINLGPKKVPECVGIDGIQPETRTSSRRPSHHVKRLAELPSAIVAMVWGNISVCIHASARRQSVLGSRVQQNSHETGS